MSDSSHQSSFTGQIFRGEAKSKSWTPLVSGHVTIVVVMRGDGWWIMASKKKDKVWEGRIDPGFKHRVKDNFVQWQYKSEDGPPETFGLRVKTNVAAQQLSEVITSALASMQHAKTPLSQESEDVSLKVLLPGKEVITVAVAKSVTVLHVLKSICQKRQLDPSSYAVALPPDSAHGQPVLCQHSMSVGGLRSNEIHIVKRPSKQAPTEGADSATSNGVNEHTILIQVELPNDERTVVRVSPALSLRELMSYICEKRNMDESKYWFDLPATEESLAGKTLEQLKIINFKVICRFPDRHDDSSSATPPTPGKSPKRKTLRSKKDKKESKKDKEHRKEKEESPKANRRQAPPPPPPIQHRRTQPDFIKELSLTAEKRATLRHRGQSLGHESGHSIESHDHESATPINGETTPNLHEGVEAIKAETEVHTLNTETNDPQESIDGALTSKSRLKPRSHPPPAPKATPSLDTPTEESSEAKPHKPPPVASKPKKKKKKIKKKEPVGQDEPDFGAPNDEVEPSETPDELVLEASSDSSEVVRVKGRVKEQADKQDKDLITEALKKQAEDGSKFGKYPSARVKRNIKPSHDLEEDSSLEKTRHGSLEKDNVSRPQTVSRGSPLILPPALPTADKIPSSTKVEPNSSPANLTTATGTNLKRKPRGPAPPPPIYKANTLARTKHIEQEATKPRSSSLDDNTRLQTNEQQQQQLQAGLKIPTKPMSVSDTHPPRTYDIYATRQRPTRKAPSRPAPATPKKRTGIDEKQTKPVVEEPGTKIDLKQSDEEFKLSEEGECHQVSDEIDGEEDTPQDPVAVPPPTAPKTHSPKAQRRNIPPKVSPSNSKRSNTATAICQETEDGGMVLIVKPSPLSKRKNAPAIVFKLPPPPPTPAKGLDNTAKPLMKQIEAESSTSSFEDAGSQEDRAVKLENETKMNSSPIPPPMLPKTPSPKHQRRATPDKQDLSSSSGSSLDRAQEEGVLSPSSKTDGDMTILSNEFTNFDDLLEDSAHAEGGIASTDFSNLEPIDDSIGDDITVSDSGTKIEQDLEATKSESNSNSDTDSNLSGRVSSYDITMDKTSSDNVPQNEESRHTDVTQSPGRQRRAPPSPPVSNTVIMTLNMNSNNNNNCDDVIDVPPPVGFETPPSEHSERSDSVMGESVEEGGVILVSVKKMHSEVEIPILPESADQVLPASPDSVENNVAILPEPFEQVPQDGWTSNTSSEEKQEVDEGIAITTKPSIGTQLNELDSIVSTLHEMIDNTDEISTPPPERVPPPPPDGESTPPPNRVPTPPPFSLIADNYTSSPISPKKSIKSDVIPPLVARKPSRKPSDRVNQDNTDAELLQVLKNRQEKLKAQTEIETGSVPSTTTNHQVESHPQLPKQDSTGTGMGENVQVQLQFLQQQVLQQQMMQLQQQFQQLQSLATQQNVQMPMMMPGMNMPFMPQATPAAGMPNPSLFGAQGAAMMMPQQTGMTGSLGVVQPGLQVPPSSMNPGMAPLLNQQGVMPQAQMFYQQGLMQGGLQLPYQQGIAQTVSTQALPQGMQMQYNPQQTGVPMHHQRGVIPPEINQQGITQPQAPLIAETTSQQGGVANISETGPPAVNLNTFPGQIPTTDEDINIAEEIEQDSVAKTTPISVAQRLRNRKRSEDIRSYVLGPLEDQFDALMEEVRDTDPDDHLRKTPELELEKEPASSYTGMAAALVEALKQRRLQVTEGGASEELDESNASEWLSP